MQMNENTVVKLPMRILYGEKLFFIGLFSCMAELCLGLLGVFDWETVLAWVVFVPCGMIMSWFAGNPLYGEKKKDVG